jgi:hypothetical protein
MVIYAKILKSLKTLVIHPKDATTDYLSEIYVDKNWTVINKDVAEEYLIKEIIKHDRIVMLGHGTEYGLIGHDGFIIDSRVVFLLREKSCVYIWCNADVFVKRHRLRGFYTGMIISEWEEAVIYSVPADDTCIKTSNTGFALAIKESIDDDNMLDKAKLLYTGTSEVITYNRNNLYYDALKLHIQ